MNTPNPDSDQCHERFLGVRPQPSSTASTHSRISWGEILRRRIRKIGRGEGGGMRRKKREENAKTEISGGGGGREGGHEKARVYL